LSPILPSLKRLKKWTAERATEASAPAQGAKRACPIKCSSICAKAAREYTEAALQTLVAIATDEKAPPAARVAAAAAILDRAHGKPVQAIEGTGEGGAISLQIITGVPRADDNDPGKG
jgi:hypothetical protein